MLYHLYNLEQYAKALFLQVYELAFQIKQTLHVEKKKKNTMVEILAEAEIWSAH